MVAVLSDKDAAGMFRAMAAVVDEFVVTTAPSARTTDPDELARVAVEVVGADRVVVEPDPDRALEAAREEALDAPEGAEGAVGGVVVFGSITLVARVLQIAGESGWSAS